MKKTALIVLVVLAFGAQLCWLWLRIDPEFKRALRLNLKTPEISAAIAYYNGHGVATKDITQKQLNDYVASRR